MHLPPHSCLYTHKHRHAHMCMRAYEHTPTRGFPSLRTCATHKRTRAHVHHTSATAHAQHTHTLTLAHSHTHTHSGPAYTHCTGTVHARGTHTRARARNTHLFVTPRVHAARAVVERREQRMAAQNGERDTHTQRERQRENIEQQRGTHTHTHTPLRHSLSPHRPRNCRAAGAAHGCSPWPPASIDGPRKTASQRA